MDFNMNSRLSEVLQVSQRIERDEQRRIIVFMGAVNARTDLRVPININKAVSKYRIRFSLIGFNFRQEYYEYLEVKDLEVRKYGQLEAQEIRFETQPEADQLLMLSVTLLAYSETRMKEGTVLLNNKEFSPSALIAAYAAEEPGEYPSGPVNMELSAAQRTRGSAISAMCYEGNRLMRDLERRVRPKSTAMKKLVTYEDDSQFLQVGKRVSFSSRK